MNKLALGTVQFGLDYGINNKNGQVSAAAAAVILAEAKEYKVDTIDTAAGYGNSETVIGEFIKQNGNPFKIVSKLPDCDSDQVAAQLNRSLARLNVSSLYGYIFHNFKTYKESSDTWLALEELKNKGLASKIGFSLYYPEELELILSRRLKIDLLQVPFSVFDRRFEKYFTRLKQQGIELHVRSVFLQGLVFKRPDELPVYFAGIKRKLSALHQLAAANGVSVAGLCVNFAAANEFIDKVVVGVDNLEHFKQIMAALNKKEQLAAEAGRLDEIMEADEQILIPANWEKVKR